MIDLRSDTVTKPTEGMLEAMMGAQVGDDVMGEDPTINKLEERTAEILGKEAAIYMPTGTMSNQVAIRAHTQPGDELLLHELSHAHFYESGAPAALSGVSSGLLGGARGIFSAEDVRAVLRPVNVHYPPTRLICIENTHNRGGGAIWPMGKLAEVEAVAREAGLKMHLDGARIWNATAASGISEKEYAKYFDSVSVCFSKGLGAPVGSALAGTKEFIGRARHFRKQFGGGMRQAGIVAAGALYAIDNHRRRLTEDHAHAKRLAVAIADLDGLEIDPDTVETNIVIFKVTSMSAAELTSKLGREGVLVSPRDATKVRAVTHLDVSTEQIDQAISIFERVSRSSNM
jgi:threonine aldolase